MTYTFLGEQISTATMIGLVILAVIFTIGFLYILYLAIINVDNKSKKIRWK